MSGRPLVPSKDALRALRHLALSPSAAYLGTASALCGVAALQYHASCKVRLAEKILERKRTLHSISNGRGATRVALMFEAAENGDDFTLRKSGSLRSVGKRRNSTVATQMQTENAGLPQDGGAKPEEQEYGANPDETKRQSPSIQRSHKGAHETRAPPRSSRRQTELFPWNTFINTTRTSRWNSRMKSRNIDTTMSCLECGQTTDSQPLSQQTEVQAVQPGSDLNPLPKSGQALDAEAYVRPEPDFLDLEAFYNSGTNIFNTMHPWQNMDEEHENPVQESPRPQSELKAKHDVNLQLYVPFENAPPNVELQSTFPSRFDPSSARVSQAMSIIGSERYRYVFHSLMRFRLDHGTPESVSLLERTMRSYIETGKREDWALAQALFLDSTKSFVSRKLKPMVWRIVQDFLRGDTPRLEVVGLLYSKRGADTVQLKYQYYLAQQYIEYVADQTTSFDGQVAELRKLLAGTQSCGIPLHEQLIIPTLRWLCNAGRITQAQAVYDEMESVFKIEFTFYGTQELIKGYAKVGNWSKVKAILDDGHQKNLSHYKTYGFTALLASIIDDFTINNSPDKTYDFVVHCLRTYGIHPTSQLSRKMITLALRHRRYDLIPEWLNMIMTKYPHLDTGTGSSTFAYDVSCVWRDMDATCEDVYFGTQAIATHALRDPFSAVFRAVASEAVSRYLEEQLQKLCEELGSDIFTETQNHVDNLQEIVKTLKLKADIKQPGARARLLLSELTSQAEALVALNALFGGNVQNDELSSQRFQPFHSTFEPAAPEFEQLSTLDEITTDLLAQYVEREKLGLPVDHERLHRMAASLVQKSRAFHAFQLIDSIHKSRWASPGTGREFGLDLFADWVEIAWKLTSGSKLRSVLWALVESGPHIKFDSHLILLARIAAPKTHLRRYKQARPNEIEEMEYLRERIRLRRKHQGNFQNIKFDTWDGLSRMAEQQTT